MKMLLMIPVDVIDQVPAIRDYLETGSQENIQKKWKLTLEEVVSRNKTIIDGSIDAIVVINASGIVELFNPAAEALWGWKSGESMILEIVF